MCSGVHEESMNHWDDGGRCQPLPHLDLWVHLEVEGLLKK